MMPRNKHKTHLIKFHAHAIRLSYLSSCARYHKACMNAPGCIASACNSDSLHHLRCMCVVSARCFALYWTNEPLCQRFTGCWGGWMLHTWCVPGSKLLAYSIMAESTIYFWSWALPTGHL